MDQYYCHATASRLHGKDLLIQKEIDSCGYTGLTVAFLSPIEKQPVYLFIPFWTSLLIHHFNWKWFILFLVIAIFIKVVGTFIAARLATKDWFSSANIAIAMNARGGPGIVLATVTFDLGIISEVFFIILILTAIITSLFAGMWFSYVTGKGKVLLKEQVTENKNY